MDAAGVNDPDDPEQSIADGTKVRFDIGRSHTAADFDEQEDIAAKLDGTVGTIEQLVTATQIGDPDYEFYDVKFPDGETLLAISGLHLTPVRVNKWKWKGALRTAETAEGFLQNMASDLLQGDSDAMRRSDTEDNPQDLVACRKLIRAGFCTWQPTDDGDQRLTLTPAGKALLVDGWKWAPGDNS